MDQALNNEFDRSRLGQKVAQTLLAAIKLHTFSPGDRLPSERELISTLGASRSAIAEGLRELESMGYLEIRRGKYGGSFVRDAGESEIVARFKASSADVPALIEYRELLEPSLASLASQRITTDQLDELKRLAKEEETLALRKDRRALDVEFHSLIAEAAGNHLMAETALEVRLGLETGMDLLPSSLERRTKSHSQHLRIIEAIETSSKENARRAMLTHIRSTGKLLHDVWLEHGVGTTREGSEIQ